MVIMIKSHCNVCLERHVWVMCTSNQDLCGYQHSEDLHTDALSVLLTQRYHWCGIAFNYAQCNEQGFVTISKVRICQYLLFYGKSCVR